MDKKNTLLIILLVASAMATATFAESKRVVVYPVSQHYWDTKTGDSLSVIAQQLLPNNAMLQKKLMSDILSQNPHAFINNNPNALLANKRLWLHHRIAPNDTKINTKNIQVESYSWGNIQRPKR